MSGKSVLFVSVVAFCASAALGANCVEKLTNAQTLMDTHNNCAKQLKLNASTLVEPAKLKEKHFRDMCLSNCTLEALNFYRNGTLMKDAILTEFKKNAPSTDVYDKLAKVVETCVEVANTKHAKKDKKEDGAAGGAGGENKGKKMARSGKHQGHGKRGMCNCGKAAKFMHCVFEKDTEC